MAADAETRNVGDGTVTSFNLAVDQGWGDKKKTNWYRISLWGKKGAGAAPYLLKGSQITVVGEFEIGEYDGKPQYGIRASDFTLPAKQSGQQSSGNGGGGAGRAAERAASPNFDSDLDDEVPFVRCDGIW